jgi:hypothetical protein
VIWRTIIPLILAVILVSPAFAQSRDGAHDFDSEFGRWTIHTRRLLHPLAHANDWVTYDGVKVVTPLGRQGQCRRGHEDGASGRLNFIALRLYDPTARQWSLNFASAGSGLFGTPLNGERRNSGVEFVGIDTFRRTGHAIHRRVQKRRRHIPERGGL